MKLILILACSFALTVPVLAAKTKYNSCYDEGDYVDAIVAGDGDADWDDDFVTTCSSVIENSDDGVGTSTLLECGSPSDDGSDSCCTLSREIDGYSVGIIDSEKVCGIAWLGLFGLQLS